MNIAVAPYMSIIANGGNGIVEFENLSLLDLPAWVTLYVPVKWDEFLVECQGISQDYELLSFLLQLPVQEVEHVKKAKYVKLSPDVLDGQNDIDAENTKQQLYAIALQTDAKKIFAGVADSVDEFVLSSDKANYLIVNFAPNTTLSLKEKIASYVPKLNQLKHYDDARKDGGKDVSPFSAYDRHNEDYARQLLRQAYEECPGDVDDRTYLYTYDAKFNTFVEFRPNRNNEYHGMDIPNEVARKKCPYITKLYHK